MPWRNFGLSIGRAAKPSDVRKRLLQVFSRGGEYTPQHLHLLVRPASEGLLAQVLADLAREGVVQRVFRVESPYSHGGIRDFTAIEDIPEVLHDWTVDEDIEVAPDLIRSVFRPQHV